MQKAFGSPLVLDVCCGKRAFWFKCDDGRAIFMDRRRGVYPRRHNDRPRKPVVVSPGVVGDFTDLPFSSGTFSHVVFDPPHLDNCGPNSNIAKYYGILDKGWRDDLRRGFAECFRVLLPGGTLIFKWNEVRIPLREVLGLTPEKPLYGHRSGKSAKTHWVAFLKARLSSAMAGVVLQKELP